MNLNPDRYLWSAARDATVRPEHMALEGAVRFYLPDPPNCRCYIDPHVGRYAAREYARLRAARIARGARRQRATVRVRR